MAAQPPDPSGRRELTEQILGAEQDERRRIALFLHDGPVQSLSGVALMLDAVGGFLSRGATDEAQRILERALERTRSTIGELRDLSFNLEPVILRDHGFSMAVSALAEQKGIEHRMRMEIDVAAAEVLPERTQAALYQIVSESLEGAIRRGPPAHFSVRIEETKRDTLVVTIHDDARSERRRRSIEVLEERARTLGGSASLEQDEAGSTMRLVLPVYAASE
jgi:two-component system NarL family sensor kinase